MGADLLERIVQIDQDVWQADLVAPAAGQTLTYWIEADGQPSERFSLPRASLAHPIWLGLPP